MPKVSKESAAKHNDQGPVLEHADELHGYAVSFVLFRQDVDGTPLLKGLPHDRCQCAHWGYVIRGKMTYRYADHEEVYEAGDAYYAPPGHAPVRHEPGTEIIMFSPAADLRVTEATMTRNLQAMNRG